MKFSGVLSTKYLGVFNLCIKNTVIAHIKNILIAKIIVYIECESRNGMEKGG